MGPSTDLPSAPSPQPVTVSKVIIPLPIRTEPNEVVRMESRAKITIDCFILLGLKDSIERFLMELSILGLR